MTGEGDDRRLARFVAKGKGARLNIEADAVTIGTKATCDLMIRDPVAAYEHCRVRFDGADFRINDLGSATGTFVNGLPVEGSRALQDGDEIVLGVSRIQVNIAAEDSRSTLNMSVRVRGFHFVEIGRTSRAELNTQHDRDFWARTEVKLGRFRPLRLANLGALIGVLVLVPLLFIDSFEESLVEPGHLCSSHAQLFLAEKPDAVEAGEYTQAQEMGCKVCHAPFGGIPMSKCSECHSDMLLAQHPFKDAPDESIPADRLSRAWSQEDCLLCHQEHLGRDRKSGLVPTVEETKEACSHCHGGTKLEAEGFLTSRGRVKVRQTARSYSSFEFGHDDHVNLKHQDTQKVLDCKVCHVNNAEAVASAARAVDERRREGRDFQPVPFETCARCHATQLVQGELADERDESLRGWWPRVKNDEGELANVWTVNWHGSEDAPNTCALCHEELFRPELRRVSRPSNALSDYAVRARYSIERRSHQAQFKAHANGQDCSRCHRREETLFALQRAPRVFWHTVHLANGHLASGDLANGDPGNGDPGNKLSSAGEAGYRQLSEECVACHTDREQSRALTDGKDGPYKWAPETCTRCHRESADPGATLFAPEPLAVALSAETLVERSDFPHEVHMDFRADGPLKSGCFTCHEFTVESEGPGFAAIPTTKPEMRECATCHEKHAYVGGGSCRNCHPTDQPGRYNVYFGKEPPKERPILSRSWPEANSFNHFSSGHESVSCGECHTLDADEPGKSLGQATTLAEIPIPDESAAICRGCHVESKQRFHWR